MSDVDILKECGIAIQKVGSVKSADEEGEVCVRMWYCYSEGGKCEECGRGGRGVCQVLIY